MKKLLVVALVVIFTVGLVVGPASFAGESDSPVTNEYRKTSVSRGGSDETDVEITSPISVPGG